MRLRRDEGRKKKSIGIGGTGDRWAQMNNSLGLRKCLAKADFEGSKEWDVSKYNK